MVPKHELTPAFGGSGKELQQLRGVPSPDLGEPQQSQQLLSVAEEILQPEYQRRWIDVSEFSTPQRQLQAIRELAATLPLNEYGLPHGIYRPDFLPVHKDRKPQEDMSERVKYLVRYDHETGEFQTKWDNTLPTFFAEDWSRRELSREQEALRSGDPSVVVNDAPSFAFTRGELRTAWVQLDFQEGFPTAGGKGTPFWAQLDFEPPEAHLAFEAYLTLSTVDNKGVRELRYVPEVMNALAKSSGLDIRMTSLPDESVLAEYYVLYYWHYRTLAYDLFRAVEFRRKQEERAYAMLDDHYFKSKKLLSRVEEYMSDEEEFWEMLTPKVAIDFYKVLIGVQRVSVGLPAGAPMAPDPIDRSGQRRGTPVTAQGMMKQIAASEKNAGVPLVTAGDGAIADTSVAATIAEAQRKEGKLLLARMLTDPAQVELAQQLIITFMQQQMQPSSQPHTIDITPLQPSQTPTMSPEARNSNDD